jgi:hypothetical protein
MRFTVIGHSCLYVETRAGSILVDPWLSGSAGWRSWWHFPPTGALRAEWLTPDWIYLTHHHPDHFHYPSMRRIDRSARVLIPRFGVDVMRGELASLGFEDCTEMAHGAELDLGEGVRVASYQYGFDDSTFVIREGDCTLVDLNDCKIRGRPLRQLVRDVGRPTFVFKGHSFAQGYPHCYEAEEPADLDWIAPETYLDDFVAATDALAPRYAVPFGSMVAFLHPESRHVNQHIITPGDVARAFGARPSEGGTELVTMAPGDQWDDTTGFRRADFDWYGDRERHIDELARKAAPAIAEQTAREQARSLSFEEFSRYFTALVRAVPRLVARRLLPRPIVFHVPSSPEPYFVIDFRRRTITRASDPPADRASLIRVSEGLLADAIDKRIVHFVQGSMRLHTALRPGGTQEDFAFWGLLTMWELGYLPLRRLVNLRLAGVLWSRRREVLDLAKALAGATGRPARLSDHFASPRAEERP